MENENIECVFARWGEFFEDDGTFRKSMNRLVTFLAIGTLAIGWFVILLYCATATGADLREYLSTLSTIGIILAGLGGFNYTAGRMAGAYSQVRIEQARQGLQPTPAPIPAPGPNTVINVAPSKKSDNLPGEEGV